MPGRIQRTALALLGMLVALGSAPAAARANPLQWSGRSSGACTDGTGITVVVDASAFGDGVHVRCAPQPVRSGFEALSRAGFTFSGTTQFPGLLCRIDGQPASDPCHAAPPTNAYWAYWHAPRGGSWTYSTSGAGSRVPPPGSVEGWAFGRKAEPGVDPPDPPPTTTTRPPTTTRPSGNDTGGGAVATTDGSTDGAPAATTGAGVEPTTSTPEGSDDSTTTSRDVGAGGSEDDESGSEAAVGAPGPRDDGGAGGGSPTGAIVGLLAVAGLAIAGIRLARRRTAEEELA